MPCVSFQVNSVKWKRTWIDSKMLRIVYNIHWKQHITNKDFYGEPPKLYRRSERKWRRCFASHYIINKSEPVSRLIVHWIPISMGKESHADRPLHNIRCPEARHWTGGIRCTDSNTEKGKFGKERKLWKAIYGSSRSRAIGHLLHAHLK